MAWIEKARPNWGLDLLYIGINPVGADELVEEYAEDWGSYAGGGLEVHLRKNTVNSQLERRLGYQR